MGTKLVGHLIMDGRSVALDEAGPLYNYHFAANGVFLAASRPGLAVVIPVVDCDIRGLKPVEPLLKLGYPKVPTHYLKAILEHSRGACVQRGRNVEALFHLIWLEEEQRWRLDKPAQKATGFAVRPLDAGAGSSYQLALIEVHSHHSMDAFFSGTDDADEQGFRIYGVIGNIFTEPKLRVRVGCFGCFWEVPAADVFELPCEIADARETE